MGDYKVTEILNTRNWPGEGETKVVYYDFKVEGEDRTCNVGRKPGNALTVGMTVSGNLELDDRGKLKLIVPKPAFGGGGGGSKSPEERRSIQAQTATKEAVQIARIALDSGKSSEQVEQVVERTARRLMTLMQELAA